MGEDCCKEKSCGCEGECSCGSSCECGNESCGCGDSCCETEMSHSKMMMALGNKAWEKLMVDKMKAAYDKANGPKMDKIAQIVTEACTAYWMGKMKEKAQWEEFEEKLKKAMM